MKTTKPKPRKLTITTWTVAAWTKTLVVDALKILPLLALCVGCDAGYKREQSLTTAIHEHATVDDRLKKGYENALLVVAENAWLRGQSYELLKTLGKDPSEFTREATTNFIAHHFNIGDMNR